MLNLANPAAAFRWWRIPADGVGLARMEFVVSNHIKIHPMALVRYDTLADRERQAPDRRAHGGLSNKRPSISSIVWLAAWAGSLPPIIPAPVIVRMSDFKTNEYANLIGGAAFEPKEENPMLGFRGASRYYSPRYRDGFALECRAIRRLREEMGFRNVIVMIPFCRSTKEADQVLSRHGGERPQTRRARPAGLRDVRDSLQRHSGEGIRRTLRRFLDRQQRPHPADARRRSRFRGFGRLCSTSRTRRSNG